MVPDTSPAYTASLLYLESQRRRSVVNDDRIHLGHHDALQRIALQKTLFSTPDAARESAIERIELLEHKPQPTAPEQHEISPLLRFVAAFDSLLDDPHDHYALCADTQRMLGAIESARQARPGEKKRPGRNCTTSGPCIRSWNGWATAS
ncbi:MAG: hypothetical protein QM674_08275 [Burkholderiaceae bacterium]